MLNTTIQKINASHVKSILTIANEQFGNGFLTELVVLNHIKSENKYGYVSVTNSVVSGFVLGSVCDNLKQLEPIIVSNYNWFETKFSTKFPIAVIETIGVSVNYTGMGIGKQLVTSLLNNINKLSKTTLSLVWEHHNGTPLAHILEQCGLSNIKNIPNYWEKDSIQNKYDCLYCGQPPCKCNVMVFCD